MTLLQSWPTPTDDNGTGQSGTAIDAAWVALVKSSVEDNVHSTGNPTIKTKTIIDEVVTARGNLASLNARLSGVVDANGLPVAGSTTITQSIALGMLGGFNPIRDSAFLIWPGAAATATPIHWSLGGGGTITWIKSTPTPKIGFIAARLTGTAATYLYQDIAIQASYLPMLQSRKLGFGAWVYATTANQARLGMLDSASAQSYSSYHTGDGTWQWLSGTFTVAAGATSITFRLNCETNGNNISITGPTVVFSDYAPLYALESRYEMDTYRFWIAGNVAVANDLAFISVGRASKFVAAGISVQTSPVGADIRGMWEVRSGGAWVALYTAVTDLKIIDGQVTGYCVPTNLNHHETCVDAMTVVSSVIPNNRVMRFNLSQVGSGTAGAGMYGYVTLMSAPPPFSAVVS